MLSRIRRHTRSWWTKVLFYFLAVTFFGGFGILSYRMRGKSGSQGQFAGGETLALVNGEPITRAQFYNLRSRTLTQLREQYQGDISESLFESLDLKSKIMDQLVEQMLLDQKAQELGIQVSVKEIQEQIARVPDFLDSTGKFDRRRYALTLNRMGYPEESFENEIRKSIAINKLIYLVGQGVTLAKGEARERYIFENEKIQLGYLSWDPEEYAQKAVPSEEEIREYYDSHPEVFDLSETRRIGVVHWRIRDDEKKMSATTAELKEYYEKSKDRYQVPGSQEEVRASHILLMVKPDASESERAEVRKKMEGIREDALKPGADFAGLARQYSEDAGSREGGGDLGFFPHGRLIKEFEDVAFSLPKGAVSEVIETSFGYHILKVTDIKPVEYESFEKVKKAIKEEVIRNKAHALAEQEAEEVAQEVQEGKTLEEAAAAQGEKVFKTEFFEKGEHDVPGIPDSMQVTEQAFFLKPGQTSDVISGLDDLYVIRVDEVQPAHQASLAESRDRIIRMITPEIKVKRTQEMARKYLERLKAGQSEKKIAKQAKVAWKSTPWFPRSAATIPDLGYSEDLKAQAFQLSEANPWPTDVYEVDRKIVLVHFQGREPADLKAFEEDPEPFTQRLLAEKKEEALKNYLDALKEKSVTYTDLYQQI